MSDLPNFPVPIRVVEPVLPPEVKRRGLHGKIGLRITVDENGIVRDAVVEESTHPLVNDAVVQAAKQTRFRVPAGPKGRTYVLVHGMTYD